MGYKMISLLFWSILEIQCEKSNKMQFLNEKNLQNIQKGSFDNLNDLFVPYINEIKKMIFPEIKRSIFDILYGDLHSAAKKTISDIEKNPVYDVKFYFLLNPILSKDLSDFFAEIVEALDNWNQNNALILEKKLKEKLSLDYYKIIFRKIIKDKNMDENKLMLLYSDLLENFILRSTRYTFLELIDKIVSAFSKIDNKMHSSTDYTVNQDNLNFINELAISFKNIFNNIYIILNEEFRMKNRTLLGYVAIKKLFLDKETN